MAISVMMAAHVQMLSAGHRFVLLAVTESNMHHVMRGMPAFAGLANATLHRDGRERLNREAQCQQNDDEEFAPRVHGAGV
ncbi:hypothetical protein [Paraburkholderia strydomiana]|uniref:hypothetical protein n=1 Tax=Paraburkholderia strydomiana TaxID=1245417 RepID=UPI0038BB2B13